MQNKDLYVPMNKLIYDKDTSWTFTSIHLPYHEIATKGVVLWCNSYLEGRWTMLGGSKFGFEDATDAVMFKMQFGFGV
jgi:hypothetical protein